jgi:hypothetical protein
MRFVASCCLALVILATARPAVAGPPGSGQPAKHSHRLLWTIVGAGAGFTTGMLIGFHNFDDSTYSDRKIWLSSLSGAAIGGVTGNLLSADVKTGSAPAKPSPGVTWKSLKENPAMQRLSGRIKRLTMEGHGEPWRQNGLASWTNLLQGPPRPSMVKY